MSAVVKNWRRSSPSSSAQAVTASSRRRRQVRGAHLLLQRRAVERVRRRCRAGRCATIRTLLGRRPEPLARAREERHAGLARAAAEEDEHGRVAAPVDRDLQRRASRLPGRERSSGTCSVEQVASRTSVHAVGVRQRGGGGARLRAAAAASDPPQPATTTSRRQRRGAHLCMAAAPRSSLGAASWPPLRFKRRRGRCVGPQARRSATSVSTAFLEPAAAGEQVLGEVAHVAQGFAGLVEVAGEDEGVGGVANASLLGGQELGRPQLVECLYNAPVGLCAFVGHDTWSPWPESSSHQQRN